MTLATATADDWNLTRWDPAHVDPARGHLESTFIKLNHPSEARALWVKLTVFAPTSRTSGGPSYERGRTVAEAWAIAFDHAHDEAPPPSYREAGVPTGAPRVRHVAVKQTVPVEQATLSRTLPFRLRIADVEYDGRRLHGEIVHGEARVRFDLTLTPRDAAALVHYPFPAMYRGTFPKTKLVSPVFDAIAHGEVEIDARSGAGRSWQVDGWPAMQGHNWGTAHADRYAWAHCNVWHEPEGREVVLEGFSAKVRIGKKLTTPLATLVAVRHRGVRYEVHSVGELVRARGTIAQEASGFRWTFAARQAGAIIEGSISLRDDDTVGLYYPNPDGEMTYCLNSKLARATLRLKPAGRAPLILTSDSAALEIGTHDAGHGIRMYV